MTDGLPPPDVAGPPPDDGRLALRLLGASFMALGVALLAHAAQGPLRLPAGALAPASKAALAAEPDEPPPSSGPVSVVALGDFDPFYALRRSPSTPPPDLFGSLAPLLGPAHLRLIGVAAIDPSSPMALHVNGPVVNDEGARLIAGGKFNVAVLGHPEPARGGTQGLVAAAERLRAAGPNTLGAGATPDDSIGPLRLLVEGRRIAWLALDTQPGPEAGPDFGKAELVRRLAALREEGEADAVVVVVHAGERYAHWPAEGTQRLFRSIADAGADAVLGLRSALMQGVEWHRGVPLLYGLGNPLSPSNREHPQAGVAVLARLRFGAKGPPSVEFCPFRSEPHAIVPLASDRLRATYEASIWQRVHLVNKPFGGVAVGPTAPDGCAALTPAPPAPVRPGARSL
jgi:capsule synthesis protein PGA_cap